MEHWDEYRQHWEMHTAVVGPEQAVTGLGDGYAATIRPVLQRIAPEEVHCVLDLGCGAGLTYPLVRELWPTAYYTGVDISPRLIAHCRQTYGTADDWIVLTDSQLPVGADFIICHSVLTHVYPGDAEIYLREIRAALYVHGHASISVHINCDQGWRGDVGRIDYEPAFFERMLAAAGLQIFDTIEGHQRVYGVRAA